jgi:hypothetical protein
MNTRPVLQGLTAAGVLIVATWFLKHSGLAPDISARAAQAIIGLALAFYANFIPKNFAASGRMQAAQRVAGWAFAAAGLAYAAIWALAPLTMAANLSMIAVASAMVATLFYAIRCLMRPRADGAVQ